MNPTNINEAAVFKSAAGTIQIRQAVRADAAALSVLAIHVWLTTYPRPGIAPAMAAYLLNSFGVAEFERKIAAPELAVLLAEQNGALLAYGLLNFDSACPCDPACRTELQTLYVDAHAKRRGIGKQLLLQLEQLAGSTSGAGLWLSANAENQPALNFYDSLGYRHGGQIQFELDGQFFPNRVLIAPADRQNA